MKCVLATDLARHGDDIILLREMQKNLEIFTKPELSIQEKS